MPRLLIKLFLLWWERKREVVIILNLLSSFTIHVFMLLLHIYVLTNNMKYHFEYQQVLHKLCPFETFSFFIILFTNIYPC